MLAPLALHEWRGRRGRVSWRAGDDRAQRGRGRWLRRLAGPASDATGVDPRATPPRARCSAARSAGPVDGARWRSSGRARARGAQAEADLARVASVGGGRGHDRLHGPSDRRVRAPSRRDSGPGGADPASRCRARSIPSRGRRNCRRRCSIGRSTRRARMADDATSASLMRGHQAPVSAITDALGRRGAAALEGLAATSSHSRRARPRRRADRSSDAPTAPPGPSPTTTMIGEPRPASRRDVPRQRERRRPLTQPARRR